MVHFTYLFTVCVWFQYWTQGKRAVEKHREITKHQWQNLMAVPFATTQTRHESESYGIHASVSPIHTRKRGEMDYRDVALTAH